MNRLLLMMNFCTFKNISVFRVFVKSVEPNNNKSVFKLIGKLMVWIYLSLVALCRGQCSRKWAVVSVAPHWQNGEFTMFLRNQWWLRELHCIRNLAFQSSTNILINGFSIVLGLKIWFNYLNRSAWFNIFWLLVP